MKSKIFLLKEKQIRWNVFKKMWRWRKRQKKKNMEAGEKDNRLILTGILMKFVVGWEGRVSFLPVI